MVEIKEDNEKVCYHNIFYALKEGEKEIAFIENKPETIKKLAEMIVKWNTTKKSKGVETEMDFVEEFIKITDLTLPSFFRNEKMKKKIEWCKKQKIAHNAVVNLEGSETTFDTLQQMESFIKECETSFTKEEKFLVESVKCAINMNCPNPENGKKMTFKKFNGENITVDTKLFTVNLFSEFCDFQENSNKQLDKAVLKVFNENSVYSIDIKRKRDYWEGYNKEGYLSFVGTVFFSSENVCSPKFGIFSTPDARITYEGYFKNSKFHGEGKITIDKELVYEGNWVGGFYHGSGRFYERGEFVYEGQFLDSKKSGEGVSFFKGKISYHGSWFNDYRHGEGCSYDENRIEYKGGWFKHKRDGFGVAYHNNSSPSFIGYFKNNLEQ